MNALGIDIGGTFIKYAVVDENYNIVRQWSKETKKFNAEDLFYDYLCKNLDLTNIEFVGVSAPGVIDKDSTIISRAANNVRSMYLTNVNEEVSKRLKLPVETINDGKSAGYCEFKMGNGKNSKSSAYFIIGTGIGGCLCDERGVIQGVDRIAGEFSNLPICYYDDQPNKLKGLAKFASMTALIEIYNEKVKIKKEYGIEITDLYLQGDSIAKEAVNEWCKNIILGLSLIIMMYNPEVICIGGGISKEDWFIEKIQAMYRNEIKIISEPAINTKIMRCKYNNDANILGAILYAKENLELY